MLHDSRCVGPSFKMLTYSVLPVARSTSAEWVDSSILPRSGVLTLPQLCRYVFTGNTYLVSTTQRQRAFGQESIHVAAD